MGFVGNHDDVASVRKHRVFLALVLWEKLLDGRKDHAARRPLQSGLEIVTVLRLLWRLTQNVFAAGERSKKLPVQVNAVGQDDDGRVLQFGMPDQFAGIEDH